MKSLAKVVALLSVASLMLSIDLLAQDQNPAHYTRPIPQCAHSQWDQTGATFYIVNSCNIRITVIFDSDGEMWGETTIQAGERQAQEINGAFSPTRQGVVSLFACPNDSQPVMPNGEQIWNRHYHGNYTCYVGAQ